MDFLRRFRIHFLTIGLLCVGLLGWHLDVFETDWGLTRLFDVRDSISPPEGAAIIDVQAIGKSPLSTIIAPNLGDCTWNELDPRIGPWPRCAYAVLIDRLNELGATTISFDIGFHYGGDQRENEILAEAIRRAQNVILLQKTESQFGNNIEGHRIRPTNKTIRKDALGLAPFILPKSGSVHSFLSVHNVPRPGATFPTLTLFAYEELTNGTRAPQNLASGIQARFSELYDEFVEYGTFPETLSTIQKNILAGPTKRYFNIYGGPGTLPVYSGIDILSGKIRPDLTGLAVFVGQAELDSFQQDDSFPTVYTDTRGIYLSGVELAGTAFLNLRHDDDIKRLSPLLTFALLLITAISIAQLAFRVKFKYGVVAVVAFAVAYTIAAYFLFVTLYLWLPIVSVVLGQAFLAMAIATLFHLIQLATMQSKVIPQWAEQFVRETDNRKIRFGTANAVCFRCDLSGYSRLGHRMSPTDYHLLMNKYFSAAKKTIDEWNGNFANPADDSYIVFWTADRADVKTDRVYDACRAALGASKAVEVEAENGESHKLRPRIGLSFGEIAMGPVGDENAFGFNITGNTVNLTARIESTNKKLGTSVLCDASLEELSDQLLVRPVGRFLLRDQVESKDLIEILDINADADRSTQKLVSDFSIALSNFQNGEYQKALDQFKDIHDAYPDDGPTKFYVAYLETVTDTSSTKNEIPVIELD